MLLNAVQINHKPDASCFLSISANYSVQVTCSLTRPARGRRVIDKTVCSGYHVKLSSINLVKGSETASWILCALHSHCRLFCQRKADYHSEETNGLQWI